MIDYLHAHLALVITFAVIFGFLAGVACTNVVRDVRDDRDFWRLMMRETGDD